MIRVATPFFPTVIEEMNCGCIARLRRDGHYVASRFHCDDHAEGDELT